MLRNLKKCLKSLIFEGGELEFSIKVSTISNYSVALLNQTEFNKGKLRNLPPSCDRLLNSRRLGLILAF
jgi:hypothetical protein